MATGVVYSCLFSQHPPPWLLNPSSIAVIISISMSSSVISVSGILSLQFLWPFSHHTSLGACSRACSQCSPLVFSCYISSLSPSFSYLGCLELPGCWGWGGSYPLSCQSQLGLRSSCAVKNCTKGNCAVMLGFLITK